MVANTTPEQVPDTPAKMAQKLLYEFDSVGDGAFDGKITKADGAEAQALLEAAGGVRELSSKELLKYVAPFAGADKTFDAAEYQVLRSSWALKVEDFGTAVHEALDTDVNGVLDDDDDAFEQGPLVDALKEMGVGVAGVSSANGLTATEVIKIAATFDGTGAAKDGRMDTAEQDAFLYAMQEVMMGDDAGGPFTPPPGPPTGNHPPVNTGGPVQQPGTPKTRDDTSHGPR